MVDGAHITAFTMKMHLSFVQVSTRVVTSSQLHMLHLCNSHDWYYKLLLVEFPAISTHNRQSLIVRNPTFTKRVRLVGGSCWFRCKEYKIIQHFLVLNSLQFAIWVKKVLSTTKIIQLFMLDARLPWILLNPCRQPVIRLKKKLVRR